MTSQNLLRTFSIRCGDKWTIKFKDQKDITYDIPRILSDDVIQKVVVRIEFNRTYNRTDIKNKYVLTGFIRCEKCRATWTAKHSIINLSIIFIHVIGQNTFIVLNWGK